MNNNGNGHKIQLRCKCCNRFFGEYEPEDGTLTILCNHNIKWMSTDAKGHKCNTFNAFVLKQPQLMIGSRILYTFGTALN